jgi:hypothetical protein
MLVGWSVGWSVRPLVCPYITSKTGYVAIALRLGFGNNLVFQVAAIFKRFELGDRGWAQSLCLLKNVVIDLHKDKIIEKSIGMTLF